MDIILTVIIVVLVALLLALMASLWYYNHLQTRFISLYESDPVKTRHFIHSLSLSTFYRLGRILKNKPNMLTPSMLAGHFSKEESDDILSFYIAYLTYESKN